MDITNALKGRAMSRWLHRDYVNIKKIESLKNEFSKQKPFPNIALNDFLKGEMAAELLKALSLERFEQKESDLFKFSQTSDFISSDNKILKEFREFLMSKEFICLMSYITGEKLNGVVDVGGSLYQNLEYLLPHDDRLEGRNIAYIYYLSTLKDNEGGSLLLFDSKNENPTKVSRKLGPVTNTFAFFKVSNVSFHQVDEVVSNKQRISINGWFHGNK